MKLLINSFIKTILDPPAHLYTTVSAQFALHYSFESEEKVRTMFKNVTNYLRPNGVFFGTITNGSRIVYVFLIYKLKL